MEKPLNILDENAASEKLREQIDTINKSIVAEVVSVATKENVEVETDISLSCAPEGSPPPTSETPDEEYWRRVAESYAGKVDRMREKNAELERQIESARSKKEGVERARDELLAVVEEAISDDAST